MDFVAESRIIRIERLLDEPPFGMAMAADGVVLRRSLLAVAHDLEAKPRTDVAVRCRRRVGIVLADAAGLVLLGRPVDRPEHWQMFHGGVEQGEGAVDAALRGLRDGMGAAEVDVLGETAGWHRCAGPGATSGDRWGGRRNRQERKWVMARLRAAGSVCDVSDPHRGSTERRWVDPASACGAPAGRRRQVYRAVLRESASLLRCPS